MDAPSIVLPLSLDSSLATHLGSDKGEEARNGSGYGTAGRGPLGKADVVLRLLRGEGISEVSREVRVAPPEQPVQQRCGHDFVPEDPAPIPRSPYSTSEPSRRDRSVGSQAGRIGRHRFGLTASGGNHSREPAKAKPEVQVRIDRATRASSWESGTRGQAAAEGSSGYERVAGELPLALVDWEEAYLDLVKHRGIKGMRPLAVPRADALRSLVENAPVTVSADEHVFTPRSWRDREELQAIVHSLLRRCADKCWQSERRRWEGERMNYREVTGTDPNLLLNIDPAVPTPDAGPEPHYVVSIPHALPHLRDRVAELIDQQGKLHEQELGALARIHFDRHLYQPLLIEDPDRVVQVSPPPLDSSERLFVRDLRAYWQERGSALHADSELFLLRNQGRGRGVGFSLEESGFYPDFILWMITGGRQRVVFVEPHGMVHAKAYEEDEKARLHERLPALAKGISGRSAVGGRVRLDSFILSATDYHDLRPKYGDGSWTRDDFARRHILFRDERRRYVGVLLAGGVAGPRGS